MTRPRLEVIAGDTQRPFRFGAVTLVASPRHEPPFEPEVRVLEEDTWRLLSAPAVVSPGREHPIRLMTALIDDRPSSPGSLLISQRGWLAIVYDLDQEPICREEWIISAMSKLLERARRRRCRTLSLPLLGHAHGGLPWRRSLNLLIRALQEPGADTPAPLKIWLVIPAKLRGRTADALHALTANSASE
jgi:hypothetical protein